jgi:hypothetical protein
VMPRHELPPAPDLLTPSRTLDHLAEVDLTPADTLGGATGRLGNGPRVMATLRNLAISILRLAGATSIAKSTRWLCRHVPACLRLIGLSFA